MPGDGTGNGFPFFPMGRHQQLGQLGWIDRKRPRMVSVQSSGCAPIVQAFEAGAESSSFWDNAATIASGLRVPRAFADTLILRCLLESRGSAVAIDDELIVETIRMVAAMEGLLLSPEGAATVAALPVLRDRGFIQKESRVLLFNTGSGLKYAEVLQVAGSRSARA